MASPTRQFSLLRTAQEWNGIANESGTQARSLKSCQSLLSGSRVSDEQSILFRALYLQPTRHFDPNAFGLQPYFQQAMALTMSAEFQRYLAAVRAGHPHGANLIQWQDQTLFKTAFRQQQEILHGTMLGQIPVGETVINTALITFLQSIKELIPAATKHWSAGQAKLEANFGKIPGRRGTVRKYVAITDGRLVDWRNVMRGIAECKKNKRAQHSPQVEKQEAAEFVAWVKSQPDAVGNQRPWYEQYLLPELNLGMAKVHRRPLVCQDGKELYILFLEYGPAWVEYISKNRVGNVFPVPASSLARISTFGPWEINNADEMLLFAQAIVAILLHP